MAWLVGRIGAGACAAARLARGIWRRPPLVPDPHRPPPRSVSVVIPARDEEYRIGPALAALVGDPQVAEVVVVDDCSTDRTAEVAAAAGARVVNGRPLPEGWVGKPWALQQGLEAATGEWLVTLDADVEPKPGLVSVLVAVVEDEGWDHLSAGGRFVCDTAGQRLLHPAMLATLVYRFGPPGLGRLPPAHRIMANGQCTVTRRSMLAAQGGYVPIAGHLTDDVALARHLARAGWRVGFLDVTGCFDVRMHNSAGEAWRNWGRSLPLADVAPWPQKVVDLAVVWLALALPLPRLLARRGDRLDLALVVLRLGLLAGTAGTYRQRGLAYWCSPLADLAVAARLTWGTLRPGTIWRGRTYPAGALPPTQ